MSDRPLWMPSVMDVVNAGVKFSLSEGGETIESVCRRTGLRAQIAAWEEMRSMFNGPSLQVIIREKIIALRKELEG